MESSAYTADDAARLPHKYIGYKVFSKWVASDPALFIVRRFAALNTRVMLALQAEITVLEDELDHMDDYYSRTEMPEGTNNGSFREDPFDDRRRLVSEVLPRKLADYNKLINEYSQLASRPPPYPQDVEAVDRWFKDVHLGAIDDVESAYIKYRDDLIRVDPKIKSQLRNFIESTFLLRTRITRRFFGTRPREYGILQDDQTIWINDTRVDRLSSGVLGLVGLFMLIGPLWILNYVKVTEDRLGVITGFVSLFFVLVVMATTARLFDALAATAAYSAVLMVFMQPGSISH